jgi:hypothetical protein
LIHPWKSLSKHISFEPKTCMGVKLLDHPGQWYVNYPTLFIFPYQIAVGAWEIDLS